ncbi:leucine--tRNA ligase [Candidatus Uhrbacteria bacterium]|nr:leucine--tRNA ligase [Candidatus Uhrbacteria bacterium]
MVNGFQPREIEEKWQAVWAEQGIYEAKDLPAALKDRKFYGLIEFPFPSGEGLHVGHPRSYTAIDIVTRKKRMEGKNVLYPIGWDAFGLPAENYAIKTKTHPSVTTAKNIANFKRQLTSIGLGFDWSREIDTTDPTYYKWTQWLFLKFFQSYFDPIVGRALPIEALAIPEQVRVQGELAVRDFIDSKRMAFKSESTINWCPRCKIGLANEEAQGGVCERCGNSVEQRVKKQWMIRITAYADRLVDDLEHVDYLEKIKAQQIHWIGRSKGAYVDFAIQSKAKNLPDKVTVFTTRPDTLFGVTYVVLAPEHPLIQAWINDGDVSNADEIRVYQEGTNLKSELQRQEQKEKTGVEVKGIKAVNPATGEDVPIWIADYVLGGYGTGAIMAVPAHDERDFEFAKLFGLPLKTVVASSELGGVNIDAVTELPWTNDGVVINSGMFDGMKTADAKEKMIDWLSENGFGEAKTTYRLRDWVFSRQRYWGEPIPIVICPKCGYVPVPESQLPVLLPEVKEYEPSDTGESPLAAIRSWVDVVCPSCSGNAERETDTMPNWAGSSWYFLRYCDPHNDQTFADPEKLKFWMPVDLYNGGMEHTTLHLLYSRFWYKFLWDLNLVPRECGSEPYAKRRSHALIMGEGGMKMSKSKGNVVNPDDVVAKYGADVFRMYEMFIGPFDQDAPWDTNGIEGLKRFLEKVWKLQEKVISSKNSVLSREKEVLLHRTIKKVSEDIEGMHFNTAVSAMMILVNALQEEKDLQKPVWESFLKLLAPFAPHIAEELWHQLGYAESIHVSSWPTFDSTKLQHLQFELVIQVNGKVRDKILIESDLSEDDVKAKAVASEKIQQYLEGKMPHKVVYVKGRLVSIAV